MQNGRILQTGKVHKVQGKPLTSDKEESCCSIDLDVEPQKPSILLC